MGQFRTENKNVFAGIITSKMRVRILMRLFLNPKNRAYLREMAAEFGASPGQLKEELGQLSRADLVQAERVGRHVYYRANQSHALFSELNAMVRKALGIDQILCSILQPLENVERAALIDDYAEGKDKGIVDLVLLGNIDHSVLHVLTLGLEGQSDRKIRTLTYTPESHEEFYALLQQRPSLVIWEDSSGK